nr:hypothetical protein Iba_chr03fCG2270 [Ipomoea batatas]
MRKGGHRPRPPSLLTERKGDFRQLPPPAAVIATRNREGEMPELLLRGEQELRGAESPVAVARDAAAARRRKESEIADCPHILHSSSSPTCCRGMSPLTIPSPPLLSRTEELPSSHVVLHRANHERCHCHPLPSSPPLEKEMVTPEDGTVAAAWRTVKEEDQVKEEPVTIAAATCRKEEEGVAAAVVHRRAPSSLLLRRGERSHLCRQEEEKRQKQGKSPVVVSVMTGGRGMRWRGECCRSVSPIAARIRLLVSVDEEDGKGDEEAHAAAGAS